jgi:hypothetical protein
MKLKCKETRLVLLRATIVDDYYVMRGVGRVTGAVAIVFDDYDVTSHVGLRQGIREGGGLGK